MRFLVNVDPEEALKVRNPMFGIQEVTIDLEKLSDEQIKGVSRFVNDKKPNEINLTNVDAFIYAIYGKKNNFKLSLATVEETLKLIDIIVNIMKEVNDRKKAMIDWIKADYGELDKVHGDLTRVLKYQLDETGEFSEWTLKRVYSDYMRHVLCADTHDFYIHILNGNEYYVCTEDDEHLSLLSDMKNKLSLSSTDKLFAIREINYSCGVYSLKLEREGLLFDLSLDFIRSKIKEKYKKPIPKTISKKSTPEEALNKVDDTCQEIENKLKGQYMNHQNLNSHRKKKWWQIW